MSDTGYEGRSDPPESSRWTVELERQYTAGSIAVIQRDGRGVGFIRCRSEEEFEWIKERLTGEGPNSTRPVTE